MQKGLKDTQKPRIDGNIFLWHGRSSEISICIYKYTWINVKVILGKNVILRQFKYMTLKHMYLKIIKPSKNAKYTL